MKIKAVKAMLPPGFILCREKKRVLITSPEWRECLLPLVDPAARSGAEADILSGRGKMPVFPTPRGRLVFRRYYHGGALRYLTRDLLAGAGRPLRELKMSIEAARAGLPVPAAAGVILEPLRWGLIRAEFITVLIPGAVDLRSYLEGLSSPTPPSFPAEKREVIARAAGRIREMHEKGFSHGDLQLKNVLIAPSGRKKAIEIFLLDFDQASRDNQNQPKTDISNLCRLYRSFQKIRVSHPLLPERDALRFLSDYVRGDKKLMETIIARVRKTAWKNRLHLIRWKIIMKFQRSIYPSPFEMPQRRKR